MNHEKKSLRIVGGDTISLVVVIPKDNSPMYPRFLKLPSSTGMALIVSEEAKCRNNKGVVEPPFPTHVPRMRRVGVTGRRAMR